MKTLFLEKSMQVLLFVGENFYPRAHLGDFVQVMSKVPTPAELAAIIAHMLVTNDRFNVCPQWASALTVDPVTHKTSAVHWEIERDVDTNKLRALGCKELWQDGNTEWYGIREVRVNEN